MKYKIKFFFEWGTDLCLWSGNSAAIERYGICEIPYERIGISDELRLSLAKMGEEYQGALNWEYPPDPSPWTQAQKDDFMLRAQEVFKRLTEELGEDHEVIFSVSLPE